MPTPTNAAGQPLDLWQSVPYLKDLPATVVQALANVANVYRYAANTIIFNEGEPVSGLYLVEEGTVKICRFSKDGREQTLRFMPRGDTFNDVAALDGGPNPATAIAYTDVTLWRITRPDLRYVVDRNPTLAWALIENMSHRARYLVGLVHDLSLRNVKGRLARLLLEQAEAAGRGESPPLLTQEEMANRLGTVREMVGRALRSLSNAGLIEFDRHRLVILDAERLAEEAEL
ncbi:MAG: Crp/Fnr family transcriptional regulator [Caldilineaceae bacterium]